PDADRGFVLQAVAESVGRRHMDVSQSADHASVDGDAARGAFECAAGGAVDVTRFANRRINTELELLGHRDLDLRGFPCRAEHTHPLDPAFWPDNRELFLAGVLTRLRKVSMFRELMTSPE